MTMILKSNDMKRNISSVRNRHRCNSNLKTLKMYSNRRRRRTRQVRRGRRVMRVCVGRVLIVAHISRVVPQTDLHTTPQGSLVSVCVTGGKEGKVGGFSATHHRLQFPLILIRLYPRPPSLWLSTFFLLLFFSFNPSPTYQRQSAQIWSTSTRSAPEKTSPTGIKLSKLTAGKAFTFQGKPGNS